VGATGHRDHVPAELTTLTSIDIGAFGYLTKAEGPTHLIAAIRAAAEHRPYTPPSLARAIQDGLIALDEL
jgi:DNA-binding NarL/FixJ family response regulator